MPRASRARPRLDREAIAAAAIAVADRDGLEAVTMRHVAQELGAGTMSLYHYVPTKDALLAAMGDAIMEEFLVPEQEMPADWRGGLRAIARRTRDCFLRHPWMLTGMLLARHGDDGPGDNLLRHADQTLGTLAGLGLSPVLQLRATGAVDDYVMGRILRAQVQPASDGDGREEAERWAQWLAGDDRFPHLQALAAGDPGEFSALLADGEDERFEQGLEIVLDGIAALIARDGYAPR